MELNGKFEYRQIETNQDILQAYEIYRTNGKYFRLVVGKDPELQDIGNDRAALPERVSREKKHYGLYWKDGRAVAVLDATEGFPEPDTLYIGFLMVNGNIHRKGIGRTLYEQIEEKAIQMGYSRIHAGVEQRNEKGRAFWIAMGFREVKSVETKSPYGTDWLVHVMEKKLTV